MIRAVLPGVPAARQLNLLLEGFDEGDRIEIADHVARWFDNDRYGTVVAKGAAYLHVRLDNSRAKIRRIAPENARIL